MKYKYKLIVNEGNYTSNSIILLLWEIFKHRCYHLYKHGKWVD